MAFDAKWLTPLSVGSTGGSATSGGPRLWAYDGTASGSNDTGAAITAINFFRSTTYGGLRQGDFVLYRGNDNATGIVSIATISTSASTGLKYTSSALA